MNPDLQPQDKRNDKYKQGTALTYQGVLDRIEHCLFFSKQEGDRKGYSRACEYLTEAEILLGLIDVHFNGHYTQSYGYYNSVVRRWQRMVEAASKRTESQVW